MNVRHPAFSAFLISLCLLLVFQTSMAQKTFLDEQREFNPTKFKVVAIGGAAFYAGTLAGLSTIWYDNYDKTYFHLFDDNQGWMQVDKFGHSYTAYIMGKGGYKSLMWAGVDRKKAIWFGGSYGFLFLTSVEILDGHYKQWGLSVGDVAANALGSMLFIGQQLWVGSQVVTMKFSYNPTPLAQLRPDHLGSGNIERIIKDYNGQTYWFSTNYRSIFKGHTIIPKWLNIAGGYGAYGMLGGKENPDTYAGQRLPEIERYRRYFLSLDIDFDRIESKNKVVRSVFFFLNLIKVPLPTLEYNSKGEVIFHPIYF